MERSARRALIVCTVVFVLVVGGFAALNLALNAACAAGRGCL